VAGRFSGDERAEQAGLIFLGLSSPVGNIEVSWFLTKLRNLSLNFGILITGSDEDRKQAHDVVSKALAGDPACEWRSGLRRGVCSGYTSSGGHIDNSRGGQANSSHSPQPFGIRTPFPHKPLLELRIGQ
jgi:hypothetical protein